MKMYNQYSELQNEKCYACKFCVWIEEFQEDLCEVKGCYKNSKFVYFSFEDRLKGEQYEI